MPANRLGTLWPPATNGLRRAWGAGGRAAQTKRPLAQTKPLPRKPNRLGREPILTRPCARGGRCLVRPPNAVVDRDGLPHTGRRIAAVPQGPKGQAARLPTAVRRRKCKKQADLRARLPGHQDPPRTRGSLAAERFLLGLTHAVFLSSDQGPGRTGCPARGRVGFCGYCVSQNRLGRAYLANREFRALHLCRGRAVPWFSRSLLRAAKRDRGGTPKRETL
jgi:hypothetical protein